MQQLLSVKPILEAIDVRKAYANHVALDGVSLEIPEGSIFGLLGPNGAGKTSLIRIITQITGADEGEIRFRGERLNPSAHRPKSATCPRSAASTKR